MFRLVGYFVGVYFLVTFIVGLLGIRFGGSVGVMVFVYVRASFRREDEI